MNSPRFFFIFCAILLLSGCLGAPSAIKISPAEREQMAVEVQLARKSFQRGDYSEAERRLVPLSEKQSIDQPLYQYELASTYLLDGKREEAHQALLAVHHSIEGFFDVNSEKKAASLWGKEADKVFKGEPYERASLYFLLALSFLERNNPDNALAALKTGLLSDSDAEENGYKSDFGLLQLLAAKCYDLRGEPELRDQMLAAAFTSVTSISGTSQLDALKLVEKYAALKKQHALDSPPPPRLAQFCALATAANIEMWLKKNEVPANTAHDVALWAEKSTENINPLDYNALAIIWQGSSPQAVRSGQYGEIRLISPGNLNPDNHCSVAVGTVNYNAFSGFGDINYQATTRGGREMDNVLGSQASFKSAADTGGDVLIATGAVGTGNSDADLILFAGGLLFKVLSSATHPEADIRYWHNLPARFEIIPLKFAPGTHTLQLLRTNGVKQERVQRALQLTISEDTALSVFHLRVLEKNEETIPHSEGGHLDQDGITSLAEKELAQEQAFNRDDTENDQNLTTEEKAQLQKEISQDQSIKEDPLLPATEQKE